MGWYTSLILLRWATGDQGKIINRYQVGLSTDIRLDHQQISMYFNWFSCCRSIGATIEFKDRGTFQPVNGMGVWGVHYLDAGMYHEWIPNGSKRNNLFTDQRPDYL